MGARARRQLESPAMAQKMTESVEPIELVLEFLAAKGFVNAEAALREQLELERTPLPVTEQGFSQLEAMLIRSATAGPAKSTGSILQEMRPPVLKAIVADEDDKKHTLCLPHSVAVVCIP